MSNERINEIDPMTDTGRFRVETNNGSTYEVTSHGDGTRWVEVRNTTHFPQFTRACVGWFEFIDNHTTIRRGTEMRLGTSDNPKHTTSVVAEITYLGPLTSE